MKKFELALLLGFVISIFIGSVTTFAKDCDNIRSNVIRLHIMASSDEKNEQELKLKVRDAVLEQAGDVFLEPTNLAQAKETALKNLDRIKRIAQSEIKKQGYNHQVNIELVNMYFTTREYDDFIMPAGKYDAIRITIDEGKGKNWWCVMYPPMCIPSAQGQDLASTDIDEAIYKIGSKSIYEPRFAVVEIIESIKEKMKKQAIPSHKIEDGSHS